MISVQPEELTFEVELEKPSYCNIKVVNNTEHHVAFKVSETRFIVRFPPLDFPAIGICLCCLFDGRGVICGVGFSSVQYLSWVVIKIGILDNCIGEDDISHKVFCSAQRERGTAMGFMYCNSDMDEIPADTFNKDSAKVIEELKLRVVYTFPSQSGRANSEEESGLASSASGRRGSDVRYRTSSAS
ncbi:hypothetical protein BHE74_00019029 [Ensete ventricosum]|nr:hypothetical protein BHE74_00019029 [Ensete ventricosum]RZR96550.1 hypothetical protein BHM03_00025597 [Ensete ventricosum]